MYFDRFSREVAEEYIKRLLEKHEREMVQNNANPYYNPNNNIFKLSAFKEEPIYQNPNINSKYAGLNPMEKVQKALSKSPVSTTEGHYYGLSSRLNDGDKLSKYDKEQNNIYSVQDFNGQEHGQSYAQKAAKMKG